jgi:hypothetical protein
MVQEKGRLKNPILPAHLAAVFDEIGDLLVELEGQGVDFWGYAGLIDLRLGRQMLLLADQPRASGLDTDPDPRALPAMAEVALLRWPSPTQLDSLVRRPRQVLAALQARPQRGKAAASRGAALVQAVQRLVDRLDAAVGLQSGG